MPIRIQCPTCQTSLSMPETMYGKAVRCPSCQNAFQCPPGPAAAAPPAAPAPTARRRPAGTPTARGRQASNAPFDFEPAAASAPPDRFDYDRGFRPRRRTSWDKVRSGIFLLYFSALCFLLYFGLTLAVSFGDIKPTEATTAKIVLVLIVLLQLAGAVLAAIGEGFCCALPYDSGAKGAITVSTVFMILTTLLVSVIGVFTLKVVFTEQLPEKDTVELLELLGLAQKLTLFVAVVLFFSFLLLTAVHLRMWVLVNGILGYCVVMGGSCLGLYLYLDLRKEQVKREVVFTPPSDPSGLKVLIYVGLLVGAVWFMLLLAGLSSGASRASRRAG
ncbi:MAG TPA: hypothetical protein VKD72_24670 [Gemmataceae bacterium]|nr:hypothetical protein [Gemmataceae bacterium]